MSQYDNAPEHQGSVLYEKKMKIGHDQIFPSLIMQLVKWRPTEHPTGLELVSPGTG